MFDCSKELCEKTSLLEAIPIALGLTDGVKVNYGKFGSLLAEVKAVHGKKAEGV